MEYFVYQVSPCSGCWTWTQEAGRSKRRKFSVTWCHHLILTFLLSPCCLLVVFNLMLVMCSAMGQGHESSHMYVCLSVSPISAGALSVSLLASSGSCNSSSSWCPVFSLAISSGWTSMSMSDTLYGPVECVVSACWFSESAAALSCSVSAVAAASSSMLAVGGGNFTILCIWSNHFPQHSFQFWHSSSGGDFAIICIRSSHFPQHSFQFFFHCQLIWDFLWWYCFLQAHPGFVSQQYFVGRFVLQISVWRRVLMQLNEAQSCPLCGIIVSGLCNQHLFNILVGLLDWSLALRMSYTPVYNAKVWPHTFEFVHYQGNKLLSTVALQDTGHPNQCENIS